MTAYQSTGILPRQLPRSQADWDAFILALSSWQPQAPAWKDMTLQNGWVAYGGIFAAPQWQIDLFGRVHCRGLIQGGTVTDGTVITTLPFAPSEREMIGVLGNNSSASAAVRLDVDTSGNIMIYSASGLSGYTVSLDNLSYSLAQ